VLDILLHIALAALFTIGIRWAQLHAKYDVMVVGAINYLAAGILSVVALLLSGAATYAASWPAVLTGGALGANYFIAFFLLLGTLKLRGAAIASALSRLAIVVPIALAVVVWQERPSATQWLGIGVSLIAVFLMNAPQKSSNESQSARGVVVMVLFFLFAGGAFSSQEVFNRLVDPGYAPVFLTAGFAVASLGSLGLLLLRRVRPSPREIAAGCVIGAANSLQVLFLLRALEQMPAFLAFALSAAGGLLATALAAGVVLGERPAPLRSVGIGTAAVALVLLQAT
jgi:drug/metabolite transporter (DMT)-like permease